MTVEIVNMGKYFLVWHQQTLPNLSPVSCCLPYSSTTQSKLPLNFYPDPSWSMVNESFQHCKSSPMAASSVIAPVGGWLWLCQGAAPQEAQIVVSSSERVARASIRFTSIPTVRLFAHRSSNTPLVMASHASDAIETECTMAGLFCSFSNRWTAGGSETLHMFSYFPALSATHDQPDMHNV